MHPASTAVDQCYQKALRLGNHYFAVQYNTQCFTSGDAGKTYDKYGRASGCSNGRGGSWAQSVYRINAYADTFYTDLGCFKDEGSRAIAGGFVNFRPASTAVYRCYQRALRQGNQYFAVQYDTECFTAHNAWRTYAKYGRTSGCQHGRGGGWKQNVYRINNYA